MGLQKLTVALLCLLFVSLVGWVKCSSVYGNLKLELVQVLFRHGERTPQRDEARLIADASNSLEEPWGYAQLTNNGKKQEYKLGEMLRWRYDNFLGVSYRPEDLYACSSGFDRTKASLQLVLASLYPPSSELSWNEDLKWMPVPIHFVPKELDVLFNLSVCPKYKRLWKQLMNSREMRRQIAQYNDIFKFLNKLYPNIDFDLEQLFYMNNLLNIQKTLNATLPEWYDPEIHERLTSGAKLYLDALSYTPGLIRLNGGGLTRRLVENMNVRDEEPSNPRKLYLYSGHEFTVYAVAKAHNVTLEKSPAYGSALILEKWRGPTRDKVYIKMHYWTGPSEELQPVKLNNCDEFCHIDDYVRLVQPHFSTDDELLCLYKNLKPSDLAKYLSTDTFAAST